MKKLVAFVLVLCLILGLVGCSKPADKNAAESTGTSPATEPTTPNQDPNAIYRDVTVAEASHTTTEKIPGYELDLSDSIAGEYASPVYHYRFRWGDRDDPGDRGDSDNCRLIKFDGQTQLWSTRIKSFSYEGITVLSDGVIGYGRGGMLKKDHCIIKFDENGKVLWLLELENPEIITIKAVVENADGSYAAFCNNSNAKDKGLWMYQISAEGKETFCCKIRIDNSEFGCAARVGDGYWLRVGRDEFTVLKVDNQGNITGTLSFGEANNNYHIRGMVEYNGKVYMSVNFSPKIAEKMPDSNNSQDIYDVLALCKDLLDEEHKKWEEEGSKFSVSLWNKEIDITERIKNHYGAMLLVCDVSTGKPLACYSVKQSFGGKLAVNEDGVLLWNVKRTETANLYPFGSSLWSVDCQMYRYIFDVTGKPISVKKMDETVDWYYDWGYT